MSKQPTKLRIVSEGQAWSTRVETESGELLPVYSVQWEMDAQRGEVVATIVCAAELVADGLIVVSAKKDGDGLILKAVNDE